jgi:ATP adenylyltransferase
MDQLWSPWRFRYVSEAARAGPCIFCQMAAGDAAQDREHFILHRGRCNFLLLNLFPYTTGHAMIAPYAHVASLDELDSPTLTEMFELAQRFQRALRFCYHPDGYNLGMNLGRSAGAGIEDHLHLHILPRWFGDSSFMTVIGETRTQPEDLSTTYEKLTRTLTQQG